MSGFVDELERAILNHVFNKVTYTPPSEWFLGLFAVAASDAGTGFTEPSGGGYSRIATDAADWDEATGSAPALITNAGTLTFPAATADWAGGANITGFGLFETLTGGTPKMIGSIGGTPTPILASKRASFAAGVLSMKLGDPGDTY